MIGDPNNQWPQRPANELFPDLLTTLDVAMLLRYDAGNCTPEQGRRNVRKLVKEAGLPTLGRIGSSLMYRREAIVDWLSRRGDNGEEVKT